MITVAMLSYLLQTTLAVSLLTGLVLVIRGPFAKAFGANTAYMLWAIPMARLIMPPLPANWTMFGAISLGETRSDAVHAAALDPILISELATTVAPVLPIAAAPDVSFWSQAVSVLPPLIPSLLAIWAAGALYVFGMLMMRQMTTAQIIKTEAADAGPALQTRAMDIRQTLGLMNSSVTVQTSLISSSPLVSGLIHPTILLPAWFEDDYNEEEQQLAILHEMMHVKRGDLWALFAASFAVSVQWFNPLIWVALAAFRRDQEAACDADILGLTDISPRNYGATLLKAVRKSGPVAQPVQAASLTLNHALSERLTKMKNPLPTAARRKAGTVLLSGIGAAALLLSACAVSNAQPAELEGAAADEPKIVVRTIVRDEEAAELDGAEGEERTRVRIVRGADGNTGGEDNEHITVFASGSGNSEELSAAAREFADEYRRLHSAEGDNSAEIAALRADFEAKVERLTEEHHGNAEVRVMHIESEGEWTGDIDGAAECAEGTRQTRTVVIESDGERNERVFSSCGGPTVQFDAQEIMERLRTDGRLTEERLAEIEIKLAKAQARLAEMKFDEDFDFDFDFDDTDVEIAIDED